MTAILAKEEEEDKKGRSKSIYVVSEGFRGWQHLPVATEKKKSQQKPIQGSLVASKLVLQQREGCRITLCRFQNRVGGQGSFRPK